MHQVSRVLLCSYAFTQLHIEGSQARLKQLDTLSLQRMAKTRGRASLNKCVWYLHHLGSFSLYSQVFLRQLLHSLGQAASLSQSPTRAATRFGDASHWCLSALTLLVIGCSNQQREGNSLLVLITTLKPHVAITSY